MTDLEFMRRRGRSLFPGGEITPNTLASNIAFGTAVLGANHIELTNDGAWWFVASDFDWLSSPDERYADARSLFQTVVPFPEQGPASHRSEIYVTVFAKRAYLVQDGIVSWLFGHWHTPLPHENIVPHWWTNILAFNFH